MNSIAEPILNILTMCLLILFAGALIGELHEHKIRLFKRLFHCVIFWELKPLKELKGRWLWVMLYPIVVALLANVLVIARQFRIGKMYIKSDISFWTGFFLWILLPAFVIGVLNELKKYKNK